MKFRSLTASAALALALGACQAKPPAPQAEAADAPVDPTVATALNEVRRAGIDPATGKPRDAGAVFAATGPAAPAAAPDATLGAPAQTGGFGSTLDAKPVDGLPGQPGV